MQKKIFFLSIFLFWLILILPISIQADEQGIIDVDATVPEQPTPEEPGGGVFISPIPPEVIPGSLVINNDDIYTNSLDVTLALSAKNAFQMAVSNWLDFSGISWEPYQTAKKWTLSKGDGKKTVYAKFRSSDGGISKKVSNSIILDTTAPANVSNFEAISGDSQITLKWQNPWDFKAVKIKRSTEFYPANPEHGITVYNDKENSFTDTGLINEERYYYTAFAYDESENYASGAIVSGVPFKIKPPPSPPPPAEEITDEEECVEAGYYWYDDACQVWPEIIFPEIEKLTLEDFEFFQEDQKLLITETGVVEVGLQQPIKISIPYEKVPEVLKTIMITLEKPARLPDGSQAGEGKKSFSFLLRVNKDKTYYEAKIMPLEAGFYPITFAILDYKNQTLKQIFGKLIIKKEKPAVPSPEIIWFKNLKTWLYILGGIIILVGLLIGFRRTLLHKT